MSGNNEALLDGIMDTSMGDVEAAPEFIDPPAGKYHLKVEKSDVKACKVNDSKTGAERDDVRVTVQLSIVNTVDLNNANDAPANNGDLFSQSWLVGNVKGRGFFKSFVSHLIPAEALDQQSLGDIVAALPETEFMATAKCVTSNGYTNVRLSNIEAA